MKNKSYAEMVLKLNQMAQAMMLIEQRLVQMQNNMEVLMQHAHTHPNMQSPTSGNNNEQTKETGWTKQEYSTPGTTDSTRTNKATS